MSLHPDFVRLYDAALACLHPRRISPLIEAGGVAAALLTSQGRIYTGVCIDSACGLGMCAERNAAASMITHGEQRITRLVCVREDGRTGSPCGACREFLMQLDEDNGSMEILKDKDSGETIRLADLLPDWWGSDLVLSGKEK